MRFPSLLLLALCVCAALWPANALECYECSGSDCDQDNVPVVSCNLDDDNDTTTTPGDATSIAETTTEGVTGDVETTTEGVTTDASETTTTSTGSVTESTTKSATESTESTDSTTQVNTESTDSTESTTSATTESTDNTESTTSATTESTESTTFASTESTGSNESTTSATTESTESTDSTPDTSTDSTETSAETTTTAEIVSNVEEIPSQVAIKVGARTSRARRSLPAQAAEQLIRNYRGCQLNSRAAEYRTSACYSIEKEGQIQRGCVFIKQGQTGCQAVREKVNLPEDSVGDLCDVCQMDRCNGSASLRLSLGSLLLLLGLGLKSLF